MELLLSGGTNGCSSYLSVSQDDLMPEQFLRNHCQKYEAEILFLDSKYDTNKQ